MLIWAPLTTVLLVGAGYFLSRKPVREIPILINGLIPSEPEAKTKEESGTTILIFYEGDDPKDESKAIFKGYADERGRVEAYISSENVGRSVQIRVRHMPYKFIELQMTIPSLGLVHTIKLEEDGVYNGKVRGKDVGNLDKYFEDSLKEADIERSRFALNVSKLLNHPFARIPVVFWLVVYVTSILAFAGDYWRFRDMFCSPLESFVQSIYFSAVTITTLGYGETVPTTDTLRMIVSVEAVLGIFVVGFALNSLFAGPRK